MAITLKPFVTAIKDLTGINYHIQVNPFLVRKSNLHQSHFNEQN